MVLRRVEIQGTLVRRNLLRMPRMQIALMVGIDFLELEMYLELGIARRISNDPSIPTTPSSLLGIDRRIA